MKSDALSRALTSRLLPLVLGTAVVLLIAAGVWLAREERPDAFSEMGNETWVLSIVGAIVVVPLTGALVWALWRRRDEWRRIVENEHSLNTLLQSIGDGVIATDPDGRIRKINPVAEKITGWTEAEAIGRRLDEVLRLTDRESGKPIGEDFFQPALSGRSERSVHLAVIHSRDGVERFIDGTGTNIFDSEGERTGTVFALRDVTEQALGETALRASQEMFRRITENVTDLITVHELDGRRIFQSRQSSHVLGPPNREPVDGFREIVAEDQERVRAAFAEVVRTGEPQRTEYRSHTLDGKVIFAESVGTLIRDVDGSPEKVLVVSRDITERREGDERLRCEKKFTDSVLKSLPGIFFVCDSRRRLIRWNRNFEIVTGYEALDMKELDLIEIVPRQEQIGFEDRIVRCFSEGKMDVETRVRHRDGRASAYYLTGLKIEADGRAAMLGVGIDTQARKSAEQSLLATSCRLEKQNSALARQARNPMLLGDDLEQAYRTITETAAQTIDVARTSIWLYENDQSVVRCLDLFERPKGVHTQGQQISAQEYPAYFQAIAEGRVIPAHYARNDPRTREFTESYLKPLGITSMLDAPIRSAGRLIGVICHEHTGSPREWTFDEQNFAGSMADLIALSLEASRRRQVERELREARDHLEAKVAERTRELSTANERLQELDRLKSEFLATMSHELRTPLNSIIGFTGILKQELAGPLNEEQCKQLGMVQFSARHLLGLINDLLDLSRIESGKMDLHCEPVSVAEVMAEVVESLRPAAAQKKLSLEIHCDDSAFTFSCDRKKLFQVLLNLANNAVKFTEHGRVKIAVQPSDGWVRFSIEDTGIGIKPEQLEHLFQAFRQVDGSARRVFEGTGLGLYLCKKLVILLGGSIGVESTFGTGSCFHFTLPNPPSPSTP
jgi:PAS domain S-box-containing protein